MRPVREARSYQVYLDSKETNRNGNGSPSTTSFPETLPGTAAVVAVHPWEKERKKEKASLPLKGKRN